MSSDEQEIRDLVRTWLRASETGDIATVLELMSEDVVFLQPGRAPMRGRAAFAAAQRELGDIRIQASADIQEVAVDGDLAYCWNYLTVTFTPPGGATVRHAGHVLSVLRRIDGRWRIVRDANLLGAGN